MIQGRLLRRPFLKWGMKLTCQKIYEYALALMNMTKDDADYEDSTILGMLGVMANEVLDVSNSIAQRAGRDPVLSVPPFGQMSADVPLEDKICTSVLPYGLAAKLMLEDDTTMASYFNAEYSQRAAQYAKPYLAVVEDVY
jgi:hypothetical protein